MPSSLLPDPLKRRHLLAGELSPEKATELAQAYLAEARGVEAIAFFAKAGNTDGLHALCEGAVASGDVFLLREASTALREPIAAEAWSRIGDAAERAGLLEYAAEARRQHARHVERGTS